MFTLKLKLSKKNYGKCHGSRVRPTDVAYVLRKSRTSYGSRVRPMEVAYVLRKSHTYGSRVRTEVAYVRKLRTPYGSRVRLRKSPRMEVTPHSTEVIYGNSLLTTEVDFRKSHFFFVVNRNWFHGSPLP